MIYIHLLIIYNKSQPQRSHTTKRSTKTKLQKKSTKHNRSNLITKHKHPHSIHLGYIEQTTSILEIKN